jgi:hypothetical protein
VLEGRGLGAGFPLQFQIFNQRAPKFVNNSRQNMNLVRVNGPVAIPRVRNETPMTGVNAPVIPNLPFNDLGYGRQNNIIYQLVLTIVFRYGRSWNVWVAMATLTGILGVMLL